MAEYDGVLYGIGSSTFARRMPDESWERIFGGLWNNPRAMRVIHNRLYIVGDFSQSTPQGPARDITSYDGSTFFQVGPTLGSPSDIIHAIDEFEGDLVVAGTFRGFLPTLPERTARLVDGAWEPLGAGLRATSAYPPPAVKTLQTFNGRLYAGG